MKVRVIETPNKNRGTLRWFQCNIPMEEWTDEINREVFSAVRKFLGINDEESTIHLRLGSGYFEPGMKEIFYVVLE